MAEALEFEDMAQALNFASEDTAEAMVAFLEKREPEVHGRVATRIIGATR